MAVDDVDDHLSVRLLRQACDDRVLRDEVALREDERRLVDGSRRDDRSLDELRLLVQDDGVPAVLVGVVVVNVNQVGADGFVPGTSRRVTVADGQEGQAALRDEVVLRPGAEALLLAVELDEPGVRLQVSPVGGQQLDGGVLGGAHHNQGALPAGQHQHQLQHHRDDGLRQLAGPVPDLVPLVVLPDAHDGLPVEVREVTAGVVREEILHPLQRMGFQVGLLLHQVCLRKGLRCRLVPDVVQEGFPLLERPLVDLLHATGGF